MMNKMFKKGMVILAAAAMTLTAAAGVSAEEYNRTKYCVAQDGLCVRVAPDASSQQVGTYNYGQDVDVIDPTDYNGWTKVGYDGMQRYVCSAYLSNTQPASDYSWLKTGYNVATKQDYTVNVDPGTYLGLRTSATFDNANEIAQLQPGTKVELINNGAGTYWYVRVPSIGKSGYVNSNYLR